MDSTNIGGLLLPVIARAAYYTRYVSTPGAAKQEIVRGLCPKCRVSI